MAHVIIFFKIYTYYIEDNTFKSHASLECVKVQSHYSVCIACANVRKCMQISEKHNF